MAEIIPVEQKSQIEMHPGGRNHPYGTEKQDRDADKFLFVQQNSLHIIGYQQIGICRFINLHICLLHKKGYFSSATVRNQRNIVIVGGSNHEISLL